ncbi:MAG TPA: hypothetical protein VHX65_02110 [Pirellulales bacterium]|jgi:hypothetical protein|nr:hypothetical protein [Pirellulales bacterium]
MAAQRFTLTLLVGALGLPILLCVLMAVGRLLIGMGDLQGSEVVNRIGLGLFVLWVADLIGLVVVQAILSLGGPGQPPDDIE